MFNRLNQFIRDEQGMETVEWAILVTLVIGGALIIIGAVGANVTTQFNMLQSATQ